MARLSSGCGKKRQPFCGHQQKGCSFDTPGAVAWRSGSKPGPMLGKPQS